MSPVRKPREPKETGLREAKKRRVRARIIETAITLFRAEGYEQTRVYDITRAAELSEATFFNYFPAKDAVLGAWVHDWLREAFDSRVGDAATGSIRRPIREAVREIAQRVIAEREFLAGVWMRIRWSAGEDLNRVKLEEPAGIERLLAAAQSHGHLRRDVSPEQLAEILNGILVATMMGWLAAFGRGEQPEEDLEVRMLRSANLLLDGSRRRHERVHASSAGRTR
jgi:AcrR family transcriptional regulator